MKNSLSKFSAILPLLFSLLFFDFSAFALTVEPRLTDPAQEQRAMNLFLEVRCLVCEGQVIESSNTEFSYEMRKLIRQKILAGKSDKEIKSELVQEFGEDVLTDVSSKNNGILLWLLPLFFGIICAVFFRRFIGFNYPPR